MCYCTPAIRTPFCGKPGCQWPEQVTSQQNRCAQCGEMYDPNWKSACAAGLCRGKQKPQHVADEQRDAAQQFFEASVENYQGSDVGRLIYVTGCLEKWPWLRPNRWMKGGGG